MNLVHVCRVCLVERKKMFTIETTYLQEVYEIIAQTQLIVRELPASVCYLCYSQLRRCARLIEFTQESEKKLKLILLFGTKAETVAKAVSSRSPINLKMIDTVLLSIPDTTYPCLTQQIKTEENYSHELPHKENLEVTITGLSTNEKEQITVTKEGDITKEEAGITKEHEDITKDEEGNEIDIKKEDEVSEETVTEKEKENKIMQIMFIKQQIDLLKQKIANQKEQLTIEKEQKARHKEQLAIEKEQKAKEIEIKAIEEEQALIKQELIAEGDAIKEEALSVPVKEEIDLVNVKMEDNDGTVSGEARLQDGSVIVPSTALLSELQRVLIQNSGLLPETMEMELDGVMPREPSKQASEQTSNQTSEQTNTMPCDNPCNDVDYSRFFRQNVKKNIKKLQYVCAVCEVGFSCVERRDAHAHTHREGTPFACLQCRRAFQKLQHVESHMRLHTSPATLHCNICDAPQAAPGALAQHMRAHVSERHWCCHACKRRYRTVDMLRKHLRTHHQDRNTEQ